MSIQKRKSNDTCRGFKCNPMLVKPSKPWQYKSSQEDILLDKLLRRYRNRGVASRCYFCSYKTTCKDEKNPYKT